MILIMQSGLAYLPCLVWKSLEGGKMRRLLHKESSVETISKFLYEHPGWFTGSDALNFYSSQILCLAVPVFQVLLMEFYLGGGAQSVNPGIVTPLFFHSFSVIWLYKAIFHADFENDIIF